MKFKIPYKLHTIKRTVSRTVPRTLRRNFLILTTAAAIITLLLPFLIVTNFELIANFFTDISGVNFPTKINPIDIQLRIDKSIPCSKNTNPKLIIICHSSIGHFTARQAIRDTWGNNVNLQGAFLYFFVGSGSEDRKIAREDRENGDILQGNFIDSSENQTLKSIAMMAWISQRIDECPKRTYFILKVDDNVLVNVRRIVDNANHKNFSRLLFRGHLIQQQLTQKLPFKEQNFKVFGSKYYPDYIDGSAYLFPGHALQLPAQITEQALAMRSPILPLDDIFVTGILAQELGIRRIHDSRFRDEMTKATQESFQTLFTDQGYSPGELRRTWKLLNS